jgi:ADP-ribose pyrophosphatase YjhB (NUDIX family)
MASSQSSFDESKSMSQAPADVVEDWKELLPFTDSSHNSATIKVQDSVDDDLLFHPSNFSALLKNTVDALRGMEKSSVWVEVPMSRCGLIEVMEPLGFEFHHAQGKLSKLYLWLRRDVASKVPEFATHHLGVGAVVINSRNEILCIRELRKNYMPWKVPTGLSERGESIAEAAEREVLEETGVRATFDSILSFRHTHGMAHGRSDIFFVCRLIPIEEDDQIPIPIPQACEIAEAKWLSLEEYRDMIDGIDGNGGRGHPMMSFVMNNIFDRGNRIHTKEVQSIVPGRNPTSIYFPTTN